jgi:threonine dehydrogenase-like Zn-dependent dehydrogenase
MAPGRPGHEIVALVEDSDAEGFRPGDRVLDTAYDGAMREFHARDPFDLIPLPADRPLEEMLMAQPLGTVLHAAKKWPSVLGWDTAVIGQGAIGLFFTSVLHMLGARKIIAIAWTTSVWAGQDHGAAHAEPDREDPVAVWRVTAGVCGYGRQASGHGRRQPDDAAQPLWVHHHFGLPKNQHDADGWLGAKEPTTWRVYSRHTAEGR